MTFLFRHDMAVIINTAIDRATKTEQQKSVPLKLPCSRNPIQQPSDVTIDKNFFKKDHTNKKLSLKNPFW